MRYPAIFLLSPVISLGLFFRDWYIVHYVNLMYIYIFKSIAILKGQQLLSFNKSQ